MSQSIDDLITQMLQLNASDLHIHAGVPPMVRINGALTPMGKRALSPFETETLARSLIGEDRWEEFEYRSEMDTAYALPGLSRMRCNIFRQRGAVGMVLRVLASEIPSMDSLGLPTEVLESFGNRLRGLILVTGPTGSGKTTTLATLIDYINRSHAHNIITIEDPIEIVHRHKKSLVVQREVGADTHDFKSALKYSLRQDPDVIMIGEMRDKETVETALSAAQTGHLVLSTLHTQDCLRTVNRIIDFFSPHEREQIRIALAESLVGILSQRLLRSADGQGRVLAAEVLTNTPLIAEFIRDEEKTYGIKDAMMEDNIRGMRTFDQHMVELYAKGKITLEEALEKASSPHELQVMITKADMDATNEAFF